MAKDKKTRKGHGEETGEEVANRDSVKSGQDAAVATSGKKTKKSKKGDDWAEDITEEISSSSLKNAKESGKTKPRADSESDNENEPVKEKKKVKDADEKKKKGNSSSIIEDAERIPETKTKKKKPKSKRVELSDDEDELSSRTLGTKKKGAVSDDSESEILENKKSQKSSKSQKKSGAAASDVFSTKAAKFQLLDIEDDDMKGSDADSDDDNKQQQQEESKNEANKEEPKKGGKKSKKKERRKRDEDDEDIDKLLEELALEMTGQKPAEKPPEMPKEPMAVESGPAEVGGAEDVEAKQEKQEKKKKKKKKDDAKQDEEKEATPTLEAGEQHTVKTAAEKRKEKKERERQKKLAQSEQKAKTADGEAKPKPKQATPEPAPEPVKEAPEPSPPRDEAEEDDEAGGKKKKKKKKDEEEKRDKKRPGKKQIAAMQEALKKVQEEEERLRKEEEARLKAEEEAERRRQEKLRLEQERKERKKQREKEKRERLKAEGKLLTKTQKQNRARMEATLAALRQQGVEVPQIGEKKERAPRLGDRRRFSKKKNENQTADSEKVEPEPAEVEEVAPVQKNGAEPAADASEEEKEEEKSASEEDVKEAWDETTDDEEENQVSSKKVEIVIKSKQKHSSEESESEETESSEESEESESEEEESSSESENEGKTNEEKIRERAMERIKKRREEAESSRSTSKLRSPVVCVLGHVDTGKTKILDKIRYSHVQDSEAGGITQQIGATMVPQDALKEQCKMVKNFVGSELQVPGLLIIDTPGHESFSNLRSRGSSLCDIAILVVDIMHGLEPQTIESINLLKQKKTPFIVALNKIDRLYEWKPMKNKDIHDVIKAQSRNTKMEFEDRAKDVILQFANQGLNAVLYYDNKDPRSYISMVPTSAISGDGMGNLMALVVELTQSMMAKRLAFSEELQATVLEVKAIPGLGTTIDVILVNGRLHEGDTICLAGHEGPLVTQIRSLLMPQPLKELRVKNQYQEFKEVEGAQGVKITGKDLDKAIAGLQLLVAQHPDEVAVLKEEIASSFQEAMNAIKLAERGVYVQASTLGSLEALLDFLRTSKIPSQRWPDDNIGKRSVRAQRLYSGIRIGPVVKKDVMKASIMLEHDSQYAVILAFDVKIERDAQELADSLGVRIFQADIIYHLFDKFMEYREELKNKKREEFKNVAVFPCKLRILPQYVFNSRDPIVVGVSVEAGVVKEGTPLCVPSKDFLDIGTVTTIEINHKPIENARKGQEVCIKVEPVGGEAPKMYGRHFDHTDVLVSKITRQSIDVCKEYFRDDLLKTDWQLMVELKKLFQIL